MAQKYRLLLVDDEVSIRKVIGERLRSKGFDVLLAENGEEGLTKAQQEKPDLIILDIMLPKINGYEVCTILKREPSFKRIPIVMFTAKGQQKEHLAGMMCGADAYISKSCEFDVLLEQILVLLANQSPPAQGADDPPGSTTTSADTSSA